MQTPDVLVVDAVHNEIFVPDIEGILVFRRDAKGEVPRLSVSSNREEGELLSILSTDLLVTGGT